CPPEHRLDAARRPTVRASLLRTGTGDLLGIQRPRDGLDALAARAQLEDATNDGRFGLVSASLDMTVDADVVVAEHAATCHVASACLALHRLVSPPGDLATELRVHFRFHEADNIVAEGAECEAGAVLVEPQFDAGLRDALQ